VSALRAKGPFTVFARTDAASGDLSVKVNTANVTRANILTKNGIIHVVDSVLVPN
jgi:uncharacterized surface protein with fasciclin (FAS1) repeats